MSTVNVLNYICNELNLPVQDTKSFLSRIEYLKSITESLEEIEYSCYGLQVKQVLPAVKNKEDLGWCETILQLNYAEWLKDNKLSICLKHGFNPIILCEQGFIRILSVKQDEESINFYFDKKIKNEDSLLEILYQRLPILIGSLERVKGVEIEEGKGSLKIFILPKTNHRIKPNQSTKNTDNEKVIEDIPQNLSVDRFVKCNTGKGGTNANVNGTNFNGGKVKWDAQKGKRVIQLN